MNIDKLIQEAHELHLGGKLNEAENIYKKVLEHQPDNFNILVFLGIIFYQRGQYESAITYFEDAIRLGPENADVYYNMGNAFEKLGKLEKAAENYMKAIQLNPILFDAYNNLGLIYQSWGHLDRAVTYYRKALELNPGLSVAHYNLGTVLQDRKLFDDAIKHYQDVLELNPDFVDAYYNLGVIFQEKEDFHEAIKHYRKALEMSPDLADAYNNIGILYQKMEEYDKALEYFQQALNHKPDFASACNNIGSVFRERGSLDEAIFYHQKALEFDPLLPEAYSNIGIALLDKGSLEESLSYLQRAIELSPDLAMAHFNLALALLLSGDFKRGWREYEWRRKIKGYPFCNYVQPLWDGSDITGSTILLHSEQGLGDTIQFIRYAPLLSVKGTKVIVQCQKELVQLLRKVKGIQQIIAHGEQLPWYDVHCSLLSLPLIFDTTLENIPADVPYISIDSVTVQKWEKRICKNDSLLKVGLAWAGNPKHINDRARSCDPKIFLPLAKIKGILLYSLQKNEAAGQPKELPEGMKLIDFMDEVQDFSDTAAIIENLDLVISVDTAVAHLAGALGKPVWTLLSFMPDWRWMLDREDSPWYPTMKLFRQPAPGDWKTVIDKVVEELKSMG